MGESMHLTHSMGWNWHGAYMDPYILPESWAVKNLPGTKSDAEPSKCDLSHKKSQEDGPGRPSDYGFGESSLSKAQQRGESYLLDMAYNHSIELQENLHLEEHLWNAQTTHRVLHPKPNRLLGLICLVSLSHFAAPKPSLLPPATSRAPGAQSEFVLA